MAEENDNICVGITKDGFRCTKRRCAEGDGTRCKTHYNVVRLHGPHRTELDEIKAKHKRIANQRRNEFYVNNRLPLDAQATIQLARVNEVLRREEEIEIDAARERHVAERQRLGRNPDAEANERREADRIRRDQEREMRRAQIRQRIEIARQQEQLDRILGMVERFAGDDNAPAGGGAADPRPLARFAADNQNVHTAEMVRQTKNVIKKVRNIHVPDEYRWNMNITSKTPGEIIAECKLSVHASCQMLTQYSHKTAIYDIEEGIYGKVLDSVWQFVKNSPDKDDLCRILKQEMEDNIGMCAQGNLTRLCNILAGYLDGVAPPESVASKMGRLLPPLMEIEDPLERMYNAFKTMKDNNVPFEEWDNWVSGFIDDEVEDSVDWKSLRDGIRAGTV